MSYRLILNNDFARKRATTAVLQAPDGYICSIDEPKRTNAQNDKMWALLGDVALSAPGGRKLTPRKWKSLFMDALERELNDTAFGSQWEPGLDGEGAVNLGHRSSKLNKSQMADLITFIQAWGDENGVRWSLEEAA